MPAIAIAGAGLCAGLVGGIAADHDILALAAGAVDDGDGLAVAGWRLLCRFRSRFGAAGGRCGQLFVRRRRAQRDTGDRLAAERVVGEKGDGEEGDQEQAEQHSQRLHRREGQPEPALLALCLLSERCAQIVGHFRHGPPRITGADDTTAGQDHGSSAVPCANAQQGSPMVSLGRQQKGRPEGRPFFNAGPMEPISSRPWWPACRSPPCHRLRVPRSRST